MRIALTRPVSSSIANCELTHVERTTVDFEIASTQHAEYEEALASAGCDVRRLPPDYDLPDAVFVEDIAVVVDELAVVTRPGAKSRRAECASVASALSKWRAVEQIESPATLDGGDVVCIGSDVFVGTSLRTNVDGINQLRELLAPHGYRVLAAPVIDCLHLKSAVTRIGPDTLLINRKWTDASAFAGHRLIDIDPDEPFAANSVWTGRSIIHPSGFPRTRQRLEAQGIAVRQVPASELAKAEGGVSCCSLIFEVPTGT